MSTKGRVDKDAAYPIRPPSNTFEMDATTAVPVELPDSNTCAAAAVDPCVMVKPAAPALPGANLDSLGEEEGKPRCVNHWDQYRAMASQNA
jgi:hypothetical protein